MAALIEACREAYDLAEKHEKKEISLRIVTMVLKKGRFLKKMSKNMYKRNMWSIVTSETARVKVAQALQYRRRRNSIPHGATGSVHQDTNFESSLGEEDNSNNSSDDQLEQNVLQVDSVSPTSPMEPPGRENEWQQMEGASTSYRSTPRSDVRSHESEPEAPLTSIGMPTEITFAMERLVPANVSPDFGNLTESLMHIHYSAGDISDTESLDWSLQDSPALDMASASGDVSCSSTAVDALLWELL